MTRPLQVLRLCDLPRALQHLPARAELPRRTPEPAEADGRRCGLPRRGGVSGGATRPCRHRHRAKAGCKGGEAETRGVSAVRHVAGLRTRRLGLRPALVSVSRAPRGRSDRCACGHAAAPGTTRRRSPVFSGSLSSPLNTQARPTPVCVSSPRVSAKPAEVRQRGAPRPPRVFRFVYDRKKATTVFDRKHLSRHSIHGQWAHRARGRPSAGVTVISHHSINISDLAPLLSSRRA